MSDIDYSGQAVMGEGSAPGDLPVNPYSLLEAVNASSAAARNGWIVFLLLMTYFLITVAGVTPKQLLLNDLLPLPVVQVKIEQTRFFLFAPIVLLFLHFGLLIQHIMLTRKVVEFDEALRPMEAGNDRSHPLRLELHSYFFTQEIAGPTRNWLFGAFLHAMSWLTLVAMPVFLILYIQIAFLPYHDVTTTWVHRITLIVDIFLLAAIGVYLRHPDRSFLKAIWRSIKSQPGNFAFTAVMMAMILVVSFLAANVPGSDLDRWAKKLNLFVEREEGSNDEVTAGFMSALSEFGILGAFDKETGRLFHPFQRNLVVRDASLSKTDDASGAAITANLRGRNLRNAKLDRTDLRNVDLTGADLTGASLVGADLRGARLSCSDNAAVLLDWEGLLRPRDCTYLRGADLTRANLSGADLQLAYMAGAKLASAQLIGANLSYAELTGADLSDANLRQANLTGGVNLIAANLASAKLHGANLKGVSLQLADLSSAELVATSLPFAQLQGAKLQATRLEAANMFKARLEGADLQGAVLTGVDLTGAVVWLTKPPQAPQTKLTFMGGVLLREISKRNLRKLMKDSLAEIEDPAIKKKVKTDLSKLFKPAAITSWATSEDHATWQALVNAGTPPDKAAYRGELTSYLVNYACLLRWETGAVASGIVQRSVDSSIPLDIEAVYARLTGDDCAAKGRISKALMRRLAAKVEEVRAAAKAKSASSADGTGSSDKL